MWQEIRYPGENPYRHGENLQTPQAVVLAGNQHFFLLINVVTK